jgi:hypothetical protein
LLFASGKFGIRSAATILFWGLLAAFLPAMARSDTTAEPFAIIHVIDQTAFRPGIDWQAEFGPLASASGPLVWIVDPASRRPLISPAENPPADALPEEFTIADKLAGLIAAPANPRPLRLQDLADYIVHVLNKDVRPLHDVGPGSDAPEESVVELVLWAEKIIITQPRGNVDLSRGYMRDGCVGTDELARFPSRQVPEGLAVRFVVRSLNETEPAISAEALKANLEKMFVHQRSGSPADAGVEYGANCRARPDPQAMVGIKRAMTKSDCEAPEPVQPAPRNCEPLPIPPTQSAGLLPTPPNGTGGAIPPVVPGGGGSATTTTPQTVPITTGGQAGPTAVRADHARRAEPARDRP